MLNGSAALRRLLGDGVDMSRSIAEAAVPVIITSILDARPLRPAGPRTSATGEEIDMEELPCMLTKLPKGIAAAGSAPEGKKLGPWGDAMAVGLGAGLLDQEGHLLTGDAAGGAKGEAKAPAAASKWPGGR